MTRNELKNLWFSIPKQDNKKEITVFLPINDFLITNLLVLSSTTPFFTDIFNVF